MLMALELLVALIDLITPTILVNLTILTPLTFLAAFGTLYDDYTCVPDPYLNQSELSVIRTLSSTIDGLS